MIIVMLSQPTPPVSELEARQLSIMFSQILSKSCLAAIPRLTNSITACEDWQSQMPADHGGMLVEPYLPNQSSAQRTVTGNNEELVIVAHVMYNDVRVCRHDLLFRCQLGTLLELEIADGPRQREIAVHSAKIDKAAGSRDSRLFA